MSFLLRNMTYPLLGALVLGSYVYSVRRGIDPLALSSEQRALPKGPTGSQGAASRRSTVFFWYGGFGGK